MPRCICKTLQKRRCKNPVCALGCCWVHLQQKYYDNAVTVQRIWIGYKTRRKCNLMKELPIELQQKILFYMTQNFFIKKHHYDVIGKIVNKKIDVMWSIMEPNNPILTIKTMNDMFYYAIKYFDTISEENILKLQFHAEKLTHFFARPLGHYWDDEDIEAIVSLQEKVDRYFNIVGIHWYTIQYNI